MKTMLEKFGVTLTRLTEDKIELVRRWRNDPKISQFMEYRNEITAEMQKKWFHSIDNEFNLYYIVSVDGKDIGLINIKDLDEQKSEGEGGIFIWDDDYQFGDASFRAICCLYDYALLDCGFHRIRVHVLDDNINAIKFNKAIGFKKIQDAQRIVGNCDWELTKDSYLQSKVRKMVEKMYSVS
jgi:RimJ/RimL family protein N-acetyltransferase